MVTALTHVELTRKLFEIDSSPRRDSRRNLEILKDLRRMIDSQIRNIELFHREPDPSAGFFGDPPGGGPRAHPVPDRDVYTVGPNGPIEPR